MTKKVEVYLEASALWNLYYGEPGTNLVEFCLNQENIICSSSIWSHLEIHRGVKKRINQKEITTNEGSDLLRFIDFHLHRLITRKRLVEIEISRDLIEKAKELIGLYNLYSSDSLHLSTATSNNCVAVLVDDFHFTRLGKKITKELGIMILSTTMSINKFSSVLKLDRSI